MKEKTNVKMILFTLFYLAAFHNKVLLIPGTNYTESCTISRKGIILSWKRMHNSTTSSRIPTLESASQEFKTKTKTKTKTNIDKLVITFFIQFFLIITFTI